MNAKIIAINDYYNLVINCGKNSGIKNGDRFLVYKIGQELFDIDTKESLGNLEIVKGIGIVSHTQEKMATLTSDKYKIKKSVKKHIPTFRQFMGDEEISEKEIEPFLDPEIGDLCKKI